MSVKFYDCYGCEIINYISKSKAWAFIHFYVNSVDVCYYKNAHVVLHNNCELHIKSPAFSVFSITKALMISSCHFLHQESKSLKRELAVTKQVMEAEYENRLQEKSLDMYCRINERVDELQKRHGERVEIVRRSFRQQLADVISKLNNDWRVSEISSNIIKIKDYQIKV